MVKNLSFISCAFLLALLAASAAAQDDMYDIGGRKVRIPAPEGFSDGLRFERYSALISATEYPDLEILASHVSAVTAQKLEKGASPPLEFYTKVSVDKRFKTMDQTPELFAYTVADLEKNFDTYIDPNGPTVRSMVKGVDKGLTSEAGREAKFDISQPRNLGYFERSEHVFSALMLNEVRAFNRQKTMLVSISMVNVDRRLLYVYVYKVYSSEADIQLVTDTTKKWTAAIIAANK